VKHSGQASALPARQASVELRRGPHWLLAMLLPTCLQAGTDVQRAPPGRPTRGKSRGRTCPCTPVGARGAREQASENAQVHVTLRCTPCQAIRSAARNFARSCAAHLLARLVEVQVVGQQRGVHDQQAAVLVAHLRCRHRCGHAAALKVAEHPDPGITLMQCMLLRLQPSSIRIEAIQRLITECRRAPAATTGTLAPAHLAHFPQVGQREGLAANQVGARLHAHKRNLLGRVPGERQKGRQRRFQPTQKWQSALDAKGVAQGGHRHHKKVPLVCSPPSWAQRGVPLRPHFSMHCASFSQSMSPCAAVVREVSSQAQ